MKKLVFAFLFFAIIILVVICTFCGSERYNVSFETNGGSEIDTMYISELKEIPQIERKGYRFNGWFLDEYLLQKAKFPLKLNSDITLYASWVKNNYIVQFIEHGGSFVANMTVSNIDKEPSITQNGHVFLGWYYDESYVNKVKFPLEVNEDLTLHAKWGKLYKVEYKTNGGTAIQTEELSKITEMPRTTKAGHYFRGWFLDSTYTQKAVFPMVLNRDITLYAKWEEILFDVEFITNGGSFIDSQKTNRLNSAPVTRKDKYILEGWYLDSKFTKKVTFPISLTQDTTLYAKWLLAEGTYLCEDNNSGFKDATRRYGFIPTEALDIPRLAEMGCKLSLTFTYDIRYVKDYDVVWDIGYAGAPEYDISILASDDLLKQYSGMSVNIMYDTRTISYTGWAREFIDKTLYVTIHTDNYQNEIYIKNASLHYRFFK